MIGDLFDISLKNFVTPRVAKFLYGITVIPGAIGTAIFMMIMWSTRDGEGGGYRVLAALFAPVVLVMWVLLWRLVVEVFLVVFRAVEHLQKIEQSLSGPAPAVAKEPARDLKDRATFE